MDSQYKPISALSRERLAQVRAMLDENGVPRPHILWIDGRALSDFLQSIGKDPYPKDGRIYPGQLYRYNIDTGRFRKVEPRRE